MAHNTNLMKLSQRIPIQIGYSNNNYNNRVYNNINNNLYNQNSINIINNNVDYINQNQKYSSIPNFNNSNTMNTMNNNINPRNTNNNQNALNKNMSTINNDTRMKCTCSKTNCKKKYCACFSKGLLCDGCECKNCENCYPGTYPHSHEQNIQKNENNIEKNEYDDNEEEIQSPKNQRVICNCTKSNCMKKYCECFKQGFNCNSLCRCLDCKNKIYINNMNDFIENNNSSKINLNNKNTNSKGFRLEIHWIRIIQRFAECFWNI